MEGIINKKHNDIIQLPENSKPNIREKEHIPSKQSANVLFKFVTRIDYLKDTIRNKAIIPRYYEEMIDYIKLEDHKKIAFPMSCFCDIHLNKLVEHMSFYGSYGIGINKIWGIHNGIQPIQYINTESSLISDYKIVFLKSLSNEDSIPIVEEYSNYLLTNLLFMKPLEGKMFRNDRYENRNFHDEREWRYIPNMNDIETELPLIIPPYNMNPQAYSAYSEGIKQCRELWLKFDYTDIKYLIVENDKERIELIRFIKNEIDEEDNKKYELISKILVFNELKEDW